MASRKRVVSSASAVPESRSLDFARSRQKRGISLEQIAEKTKISIRFLKAIEARDFKQLPGGIFASSYLRQYAEAAGLEPENLIRLYEDAMNPPQANGPKTESPLETRSFFNKLFRATA